MHGTLIKWKDDRGFGFIQSEHNQQEVFVHISAFPANSPRPKVGEILGFDIETTAEGKTRAINIRRAASLQTKAKPSIINLSKGNRKTSKLLTGVVLLLLVAMLAVVAYQKFPTNILPPHPITPASNQSVPEVSSVQFSCDGRTHCSEMSSCAEAKYFLKNCPNTEMDGDHDGVPCETQHCSL